MFLMKTYNLKNKIFLMKKTNLRIDNMKNPQKELNKLEKGVFLKNAKF